MTPAWVSQLVDSIFRWWPASDKLMAIVAEQFLSEAYLDESQTGNGDSRVYTLACLVAPKPRWEDFSLAWSDAMKSCGADGKVLHMRDLLHGTKGSDWEGWTEAQRRPLFERLVSVARTYWVFGFCGSIPLRDFEEVYKPSFQEPGGGFRPYELLLQGTMEAIAHMIGPTIGIMKKNPLVFFMERNKAVEADATRQFYHLTNGRGWADIFPSIVPLPKGPEPLQFADMVAYEGSRWASDQIAGNLRKPRRLFEELQSIKTLTFNIAPRELLTGHMSSIITAQRQVTPELAREINRSWKMADRKMQRERSEAGRRPKPKTKPS